MATGIEIKKDSRIVARSRNLRGLLDYARRKNIWVICVAIWKTDQGAMLDFTYSDKAMARVDFADFAVARDWIRARRSWGLSMTSKPDDSTFEMWSLK